MIVYDSLCVFSQVAVYTNFDVQVFKGTACPCQRRPPLEPRASMYAKRSSPSRNQSNTLQNESLKEEICFGSYFRHVTRFVRHESRTSCREFDISTKDTHAPRPQHASSIKLYTKNNSNCGRRVTHVHSSTHLHSSTVVHSCTASTLMYGTCQIPPPLLQDRCPARLGTRSRLGC